MEIVTSASKQLRYRYKRKYVSGSLSSEDLTQYVLMHPDVYSQAFYSRSVCSIYFDTPAREYYQQNLMGMPQRLKVRARWYEHDGILDPLQLEIKRRDGEVSAKIGHQVSAKVTDLSSSELTELTRDFLQPCSSATTVLEPLLMVKYQRSYFTSANTPFRVTIDSELQFSTIDDWTQRSITYHQPGSILEIKYETPQDREVSSLVSRLPLRISKSSKFVTGMHYCYPSDIQFDHDTF